MRALGVTRYKCAEFEIDLGKAPSQSHESPLEGSDQAAAMHARLAEIEAERRRRIAFAATSVSPTRLLKKVGQDWRAP